MVHAHPQAHPRVLADPAPLGATEITLDARERAILDFEREWWRYAGAKEQAIREHFDLSPTSYYRAVNDLIDRDDAMAYDPMLVKRMRRMRAARNRSRAESRLDVQVR